jgi:hypothetical protein
MKKYLIVIVMTIVFTLLNCVTIMAQVNYYVDPSGTDNGSHGASAGTNAWKTIQYAVNNVSNPATDVIIIYVSGDTYNLNSVPISINRSFVNLTIQGAGAGTTVIQAQSSQGAATDRVFNLRGPNQTVTLRDMKIMNGNLSGDIGSGIYNYNCILMMINCIISGNVTNNYAGGIANSSHATLTMTNCTVSGNTSNWGSGGIQNDQNSILTMTNCTVSGNSSSRDGGGIYNWAGTLTITNCTVANNTCGSGYSGGGIYNYADGTLYIENTILANNKNSDGTADDFYSVGTLNDNGYNICEADSYYGINKSSDITGNQTNLNLSSTLEANNTTNGTYTLKTTSGSVAINAGSNIPNNGVSIPTQDQRGANRNLAPDIGSYEYWDDNAALPVELTSFSTSIVNNKTVLIWSTSTEVNNYGFDIERRLGNEEWIKIGFIQGHGNSNSPKDYSFTDSSPLSGKVQYRLKQIDIDGKYKDSNTVEINVAAPASFALKQNFPNPFNPSTSINYQILVAGNVTLKVYDFLGREVSTIVNERKSSGTYEVKFDGSNLSSGVYLYQLSSGSFVDSKKFILLK